MDARTRKRERETERESGRAGERESGKMASSALSDVNAILAWHIHHGGKENDDGIAARQGKVHQRQLRGGETTKSDAIGNAERMTSGEEASSADDGCVFVTDTSLVAQLRLFVEVNKQPATSPNLANDAGDDISLLLEAARRVARTQGGGACADEQSRTRDDGQSDGHDRQLHEVDILAFAHLCCAALKILSRKQANRKVFGREGVRAVVALLTRCNAHVTTVAASASTAAASDNGTASGGCEGRRHTQILPNASAAACGEAANIILNICYEKENVEHVLDADGVLQLLVLAERDDAELQANAAGAMQSICYQKSGRRKVVSSGGVPRLLTLIEHDDLKVLSRAIGALHNLSSDAEAIKLTRRSGGIEKVIELLTFAHRGRDVRARKGNRQDVPGTTSTTTTTVDDDDAPLRNAIASSAAGTLQNLCREVASRDIVSGHEHAVDMLTEVLFGGDVHAQVCAAGALINVIGPELERSDESKKSNLDALRRASNGRRRPLRRTSDAGFYPAASPKAPNRADRQGFSRLLKCCLTIAMLRSAIFDVEGVQATALV